MKVLRDLFAYKFNGRPYYDVIAEWQRNAVEEFDTVYRQLDYQRSIAPDAGPGEINIYRDAGEK